MLRSEIDAIPLEGDVSFRQRAVEPEKTALLVIDLQKGEYNEAKSPRSHTTPISGSGSARPSSPTAGG